MSHWRSPQDNKWLGNNKMKNSQFKIKRPRFTSCNRRAKELHSIPCLSQILYFTSQCFVYWTYGNILPAKENRFLQLSESRRASRGGGTWGTSPPPSWRVGEIFAIFGCLWGYRRMENCKKIAPGGAFLVKAKNSTFLTRTRAKKSPCFKVLT